jgi:hypothetical protein
MASLHLTRDSTAKVKDYLHSRDQPPVPEPDSGSRDPRRDRVVVLALNKAFKSDEAHPAAPSSPEPLPASSMRSRRAEQARARYWCETATPAGVSSGLAAL